MSGYGTFETSIDCRYTAAFGSNADINRQLPDIAIYFEHASASAGPWHSHSSPQIAKWQH
jgi:hypothetical protein